MLKLLNRGLNFCVTPLKLNLAQIMVDFDQFERRVLWKEWWHGRKKPENESEEVKPIFPKKKTTLPEKGRKAIRNMLMGIKSKTLGTDFNKTQTNISESETEALKQLVNLQKNCQITFFTCFTKPITQAKSFLSSILKLQSKRMSGRSSLNTFS